MEYINLSCYNNTVRGDFMSSLRKKSLSGWLYTNHRTESANLKLQKFLFFYECLSKAESDEYEFRLLRGYKKGPVFSDVYGECVYENGSFSDMAETAYKQNPSMVNESRAKFCAFLVKIMTEDELSEFTHIFNIWKVKEPEILAGAQQLPLSEKDLNASDVEKLISLKNLYTDEYIDSVRVYKIYDKTFLIKKSDVCKITTNMKDVFLALAENNDLQNPVYVEISDSGVVLVD
jgi:hypothetical protein